MHTFPLGKLPPEYLSNWLARFQSQDARVLLGPGIGLDCAVLDFGDSLLVAKSDPITLSSSDLGWYAVHINANDIATTGARPRWFLCTLLLPPNSTEAEIDQIFSQLHTVCNSLDISIIGGHTEVTMGLDRPILCGTMLGEVAPSELITPQGARPGDQLLLTKGVPIEGASILAQAFAAELTHVAPEVLARAQGFIQDPGISVLPEARAAAERGGVTAMHDPTEGGLASALWELCDAAGVGVQVEADAIPIPYEAQVLCDSLEIDPLTTIASGALLLSCQAKHVDEILAAIAAVDVRVEPIGQIVRGSQVKLQEESGSRTLERPARDALAALYERYES